MTEPSKNKLDYFNSRDQIHPLNRFYEGEEYFDGIMMENRKMTDITCLIIFLILNAALVYYSQIVILQSDWNRLYLGSDFRTDFCGHNQLINETHLYFYDPEGAGAIGICMENCPPADGVDVCFYSPTNNQSLDDYCFKTYHTSAVGYYCMPMELNSVKRIIIQKEMRSIFNTMKTIAGNIWKLKDLICISFGIMFLVGIMFALIFLHKKAGIVFIVVFFFFAFGMIGWMISLTPNDENNLVKKYCPNESSANGCEAENLIILFAIRYALVGITGISFLIMILYWRRLAKIAKLVAFFNDYIKMSSLFFFLVVHMLIEIAFFLFAFFLYISVMSSGIVQTVNSPTAFPAPEYRKIIVDDINFYGLAFAGFMFYWWINVFSNFSKFVLSGTISSYFFSKAKQILNKPVSRGIKMGILNNIGSILYCSIIIPIVWPIRALFFRIKEIFIKTIDKTTKKFKFCLAFWTPCLSIHESTLKFIRSRNLIHIVIFGDDFYRAGQKIFYIRLRNLSRIKAFQNSLGFITFIGNIFIASSGACFIFTYCALSKETFLLESIDSLEYVFIVPLLVFFCGLFLGNIFGNLYDQLIETILFCFIVDEEMFTGRHRFAEEDMRKFMNMFGQESDDVRNAAITKVNPFKLDKDNEVIKYDPINSFSNNNAQKVTDKNLLNFMNLEDLEGSSKKTNKVEKKMYFDPINNMVKIHAEISSNKTIEEEEMEKSIKSNKSQLEETSQNLDNPPNQNRLATPLVQNRLNTPKTNFNNISKVNSRPVSSQLIQNTNNISELGRNNNLFVNNVSNPQNQVMYNSQNELRIENASRPISSKNNNLFVNNVSNPQNQVMNNSQNELKIENGFKPTSSKKDDIKLENFSRPTSSNKNDNLNISGLNQKERSFVEIKKLEIEDLENSYDNDEEEDEKSISFSDERNQKNVFKFKNDEINSKVVNNHLDFDQNKNNSIFGKSILEKNDKYQF